jgi:hypothetical protein
MKRFRLSRRAMLRGAGGVAIALPWLEIMEPTQPARAAAAAAQRFVAIYTPGGTILDQWRPTGTETDYTLSPILSPFEAVKDRILVLDGIDMTSAVGEQDQSGMIAFLTGTAQAENDYASGPSLDQVLATRLAEDGKRPSLELAVRWGTGKAHGTVSPMDIISYRHNATFDPVQPLLDPEAIWSELFGAIPDERDWDRSILDAVTQRYQSLATRLGGEDRVRLEAHLSRVRELEQSLAQVSSGACSPPAFTDNPGYDPLAGLMSENDGSVRHPETDAAIPAVGKLMMDMLVMALACDLTPVASLMWSDSEAKYTLPWLGLNETHRFYQGDGGFRAAECATIQTWYQEQHAYLIAKMAEIDMGGHSLLSESVVFIGSHVQDPATHSKQSMPFLLAGGGGGLRTGRYLTYDHPPHNELLVALLNLFGDSRTTFGDLGSGALGQLT